MKGFTKGGKFRPTDSTSSKLKSNQILNDDSSMKKAKDIQRGLAKTSGKMGVKMGFNVKTRKTEVIRNPKTITTSNGRKAIEGTGSDGTKIVRFIKG